jgi:hypothetical protein
LVPYKSLAFLSHFSKYEVDAGGRIAAVDGATRNDYDPFADFIAGGGTKERPDYHPAYDSFLNLWEDDDDAVLAWVAEHGLLGLPWRESIQDVRDESRTFHNVAVKARDVEKMGLRAALPLAGMFDDVLLGRRGLGGEGVRLLATITLRDGRPQWSTKLHAPLLLEALYTMLLQDLANGVRLVSCPCGRTFAVPSESRREYCPPVIGKNGAPVERCRNRFKKKQQRKMAREKRERQQARKRGRR